MRRPAEREGHRFREFLSSGDLEFVSRTLGGESITAQDAVLMLLVDKSDPKSRDEVLDSPKLRENILDEQGIQKISPPLYFFIIMRPALKKNGVKDADLAAYVAAVLSTPPRDMLQLDTRNTGSKNAFGGYFFDDLVTLQSSQSPEAEFAIRRRMAEKALVGLGIFSEHIKQRQERGFPGPKYWKEMGMASYRTASHARPAERLGLAKIFDSVHSCFPRVVESMQAATDAFLHLHQPQSFS